MFVVIAEEIAAKARGWANSTIIAFYFTGAGLAALAFGAVNILPHGWRALYVIGAMPLFLVAFLRRRMPETKRFAAQGEAGLEHGRDAGPAQGYCRGNIRARVHGDLSRRAHSVSPSRPPRCWRRNTCRTSITIRPPGHLRADPRRPGRPGADNCGGTPVGPAGPPAHGHCDIVALAGISFLLFFNASAALGACPYSGSRLFRLFCRRHADRRLRAGNRAHALSRHRRRIALSDRDRRGRRGAGPGRCAL